MHARDKGFSEQCGRDAIDRQGVVACTQIGLTGRLVGQRAVGDQYDIEFSSGTGSGHYTLDGCVIGKVSA